MSDSATRPRPVVLDTPLPATERQRQRPPCRRSPASSSTRPRSRPRSSRSRAEEAIAWAIERFHPELRFAVSFQKTSSVTIDIAHRIDPEAASSTSTPSCCSPRPTRRATALAERFGIEFERYVQDNPPGLRQRWDAGEWGPDDECCAPRKVSYHARAPWSGSTAGCRAFAASTRSTRADAPKFGWDERFGLWKLNPLADWDEKRVWNYIKDHHVPYNPLHDQGYPSIGCMPCTRSRARASEPAMGGTAAPSAAWAGTDRTGVLA